ncbi:MAG TPA: hypothetical protein VIJ36_02510 [Thermoanaerobaculia bacterium]
MSVATAMQGTNSAKPRRRPAAKAPTRPGAEKVKVSIVLNTEVDFRLTVLAAHRGIDRSTLVNQVLEDLTRGVVVSLRGKSADSTLMVSEIGQGQPPE